MKLKQLVESAQELDYQIVDRKKNSLSTLQERYQRSLLVVDKNRLEYYPLHSDSSFFFHPSSAVFRIKQFDADGHDPLIAIAQLNEGMTVLDCTLGLGADAIVMSHGVGSTGHVIGLESNPATALIVREGLKQWMEGYEPIVSAMRNITVQKADHLTYLRQCEDNAFDVLYFDPMFEKTVSESIHLDGLRQLANYQPLTEEVLDEAKRVARKRIVLKAHFESELFEQFGFKRTIRKSSKLHYGVMEV
ncbi:class I SAM-dependent methyltransferase [Exiguobacterium sp. S22-S28]|uniref:class I SAM-dependent methyltransferase n=1 Tax=Exiguobacterium sp. S22-S28 TaxID=3342768 RepID=UPI00372D62EA